MRVPSLRGVSSKAHCAISLPPTLAQRTRKDGAPLCVGVPAEGKARASSLCVEFLQPMLTTDLDLAFVFSGLCEIIGKLHP
jgi:hypothetical protein